MGEVSVFTRIECLNAQLTAKQGTSRTFVRLDGDVRTRPRHVGIASQHRVYAALREFCNFEVRKKRRLAFNAVYSVALEPEVTPEARRWSASQAYVSWPPRRRIRSARRGRPSPPACAKRQIARHRALVLVAQADGNRTRQRRGTPLTGFEERCRLRRRPSLGARRCRSPRSARI